MRYEKLIKFKLKAQNRNLASHRQRGIGTSPWNLPWRMPICRAAHEHLHNGWPSFSVPGWLKPMSGCKAAGWALLLSICSWKIGFFFYYHNNEPVVAVVLQRLFPVFVLFAASCPRPLMRDFFSTIVAPFFGLSSFHKIHPCVHFHPHPIVHFLIKIMKMMHHFLHHCCCCNWSSDDDPNRGRGQNLQYLKHVWIKLDHSQLLQELEVAIFCAAAGLGISWEANPDLITSITFCSNCCCNKRKDWVANCPPLLLWKKYLSFW